jgi:hypothetical protein
MSDWDASYMHDDNGDCLETVIDEIADRMDDIFEISITVMVLFATAIIGSIAAYLKWIKPSRTTAEPQTVTISSADAKTATKAADNEDNEVLGNRRNIIISSFLRWVRAFRRHGEAIELESARAKPSKDATKTDSCTSTSEDKADQDAQDTNDDVLDRPSTPSPTTSEITDVTPSRPRKPQAVDLSSGKHRILSRI